MKKPTLIKRQGITFLIDPVDMDFFCRISNQSNWLARSKAAWDQNGTPIKGDRSLEKLAA